MIVVSAYDNIRELRKSDSGYKIMQNETGSLYDEAVDLIPCKYTYTETDIPIKGSTEQDFAEAARILLGMER